MKGISEFFGRMHGKFAQEIALRSSIQRIILEQTKVEVPIDKISFVGQEMILKNLDQTAKSAIFTKQTGLLKVFSTNISNRVIVNIRFG